MSRQLNNINLIRRIWGVSKVWHLHFSGSPHEGEELDEAEIVLHELAHQTLMTAAYAFTVGKMSQDNAVMPVSEYIDGKPDYLQDLHEIKALAIELNVGRRLCLGLDQRKILTAGRQNSALFKRLPITTFEWMVRRASRTVGVRKRADTIMVLIAETRKKYGRKRIHRAGQSKQRVVGGQSISPTNF